MKKVLKTILPLFVLLFPAAGLWSGDWSWGYTSSISLPFYSGSGFDRFLDDVSEAEGVESAGNNPIIGFSLGGQTERCLSDLFSLRGEVLLSAAGGGYVETFTDGISSAHLISEMNLDIPVLVKIKKQLKGERHVYLMAGPQLSVLLYQAEYIQDDFRFDKIRNNREDFHTFGAGLLGGAGLDLPLGRYRFFFELRYLYEFSDSLRADDPFRQNVVSFTSGMRFGGEGR